jgi:hypothetical protein
VARPELGSSADSASGEVVVMSTTYTICAKAQVPIAPSVARAVIRGRGQSRAWNQKSGPPRRDEPLSCWSEGLGGRANARGAGTLGAVLDLELDLLAAIEAIEVEGALEAAAMEEVFLAIVCSDEAEAAIGDDLLDGTGGHCGPP